MNTILGQMPEQNVVDIENDDVLRVQKFMRRRKYKLHAAFLNATMVSAIDAPVEFELSIGKIWHYMIILTTRHLLPAGNEYKYLTLYKLGADIYL